ncbi:MAG TPA: XRE family transcriptional regulator [Longimicrobium sp.]|nr:XRE family transcriptional regulator [Longimicrobium sp.]
MMNELERLKECLSARFPTACLAIDRPALESGGWFLDATLQGHLVVVEWRADRGFGVSTPSEDDFGAKPDEVYPTTDAACSRVVELLLSQTRTVPGRTLPKIRESRGLSQTDVAQRLQINQGAVSRLERRDDMLVGTLRNLIAAMGGRLKLIAEFPDRCVDIQIDQLLNGDAR